MQNACTSMKRSCTGARNSPDFSARSSGSKGWARTVYDLVANEALQEDANESHEPVLHVLVL